MDTIHLTPSTRALPEGLSGKSWRSVIEFAAAEWSYPAVACTSLQIVVDEPRDLRVATDDDVNLVTFRSHVWCHNEDCTGGGRFPAGTFGMTQTYPDGSRGSSVRGADIELNAVDYSYALYDQLPASNLPTMPLEAALLHEMGHVIGLEDACSANTPHCTPNEKASVMYAPAKLTSLTSTDLANVCALHPRSAVLTVQAPLSKLPLDDALFAMAFAVGGLWIHRLLTWYKHRRRRVSTAI